ncbi:MAG: hypothetical protein ACI35W_05080 [Anaeroplasmataceae bacterium]
MKKGLTKFEKFSKIVYWIVRIISIMMILFAIIALIVDYHKNTRGDSRYVFIILQASAMVALTFVPKIIMKLWKISVPVAVELIFLAFCAGALVFGEIFEFYIRFSWWDDLLHTFSGCFISCIGYIIISIFNERDDVPFRLSPGFVAFFSFFLAMTCESVWEVFEYAMDGLTGSNMQRYMHNITHEPFLGRGALSDTMGDIIEVMVGSIIVCVIGYLDMKFNRNKITHYLRIKKVENTPKGDKMLLNEENNVTEEEIDQSEETKKND